MSTTVIDPDALRFKGAKPPRRDCPFERNDDVPTSERNAEIWCRRHALLCAVLTDHWLVTDKGGYPWPAVSGSVWAPCRACVKKIPLAWWISTAKLRAAHKEWLAEAKVARQARRPLPGPHEIDVMTVLIEGLLEDLYEL